MQQFVKFDFPYTTYVDPTYAELSVWTGCASALLISLHPIVRPYVETWARRNPLLSVLFSGVVVALLALSLGSEIDPYELGLLAAWAVPPGILQLLVSRRLSTSDRRLQAATRLLIAGWIWMPVGFWTAVSFPDEFETVVAYPWSEGLAALGLSIAGLCVFARNGLLSGTAITGRSTAAGLGIGFAIGGIALIDACLGGSVDGPIGTVAFIAAALILSVAAVVATHLAVHRVLFDQLNVLLGRSLWSSIVFSAAVAVWVYGFLGAPALGGASYWTCASFFAAALGVYWTFRKSSEWAVSAAAPLVYLVGLLFSMTVGSWLGLL